jgi:chromosome partitioning protein
MGFLSRKSRPEETKQGEAPAAPEPAPETFEGTPDESGDIKISRQDNGSAPPEQPAQYLPEQETTQAAQAADPAPEQPAAPASQQPAEPAVPPQAAPAPTQQPPAPEQAPEPSPQAAPQEEAGPMRLRAEDLITPSRHAGSGEDQQTEKGAKVISFANQKGGVAKTTTTLNLAVAFSESGHRVLCIDLDPQGNLTMSQGIDPDKVEKSLYDVLVHDMPISEIIQKREIDIAVASIDLAGAEIAMSTKIGRERSLEKALKEVKADYDFICIDTPPSLGLLTINALTASDKVIVPVQCEYLSMRGLVQLQNTLKMIQENLNPNVTIEGILPTMLDSRTVHAKEAVEILEENFGELVFKSRIRKAIKFAEAPVRGASVLKYDPEGNAANYYRELAKEVLTNGSS